MVLLLHMVKKLWFFALITVLITFFLCRDFNSRYERSINGDAKGYYAYLPAIFIYHDSQYNFIDEMEKNTILKMVLMPKILKINNEMVDM